MNPSPTPSMIQKYAKAVGAVFVTVLTFLVSALFQGLTESEVVLTIGVGVSSVGVAIVPNLDVGIAKIAKTVIAFLLAGLTVLAVVIPGGLTSLELTEVVIAALAAIGVTAIPNTWPPATQRMTVGQFAGPRTGGTALSPLDDER